MHIFSKKTSIVFALFFCVSILFAQNSVSQNANANSQNESAPVEKRAVISESDLPIASVPETQIQTPSVWQTIWLFIRMIFVLAIVIAGIYALIFFLKKNTNKTLASDPFLRVVSNVPISAGKSVAVVTLLDEKAYIIGVSDNNINLIGEIENKETIDAMNLQADKNAHTDRPRNFNDILSLFMPNGPKEKNIFSSTVEKTTTILKKKRNKLHDEDGSS